MAFNDPSNQPDQTDQGAPQGQSDDLGTRWNDWLGKPSNRAAMMQFGIAMLQPMMPGENVLSKFGSSVGAGGEAAARVQDQRIKEQEAQSREALRGSQAQLAESRAETAGVRSSAAADRLQNEREKLNLATETQGLRGLLSARTQYAKEQKQHEDSELLNPTGVPFPSFEEWLPQSGMAAGQGGRLTPSAPVAPTGRTPQQLANDPRFVGVKGLPPARKGQALDELARRYSMDRKELGRAFGEP